MGGSGLLRFRLTLSINWEVDSALQVGKRWHNVLHGLAATFGFRLENVPFIYD